MVHQWMEWAQLKAKVKKCRSMYIQASTGKRMSLNLSIGGECVSPVEDDSFKFLGMPVRVYNNNNAARTSLLENLQRMLGLIDDAPLTRQQKLRLFKQGVCPRLTWSLLVEDLPITWLERELQPLATKALKKWAGLARSSNTSILFLPMKRGGLALPSLVSLYKRLQATRMLQLLTSSDPGVRKVANVHLEEERRKQRIKFKPATFVDAILMEDRSQSRQALRRATKTLLQKDEADERHQQLCQLPAQGEMARSWEEKSPNLWVKAVQALPPEPLKFALNASLNTLPTNSNLHTWGKKASDRCSLCCEARQSLTHVLNNCPIAMKLRRYSRRHDKVLELLGFFIQAYLPNDFSIAIDSPSFTYSFPQHIIPTDLRPDIVWWSDQQKELWLFELTISYESHVADARGRKRAKYHDLEEAGRVAGYKTELITIEVGSRGMVCSADFEILKAAVNATGKDVTNLCLEVIRTTLLESFRIWVSRNSAI